MEFTDVMSERRSIRDFAARLVSRQTIEQIVKVAQLAPSWVNSQPWQVYVATGKQLAAIKTDYHQRSLKKVPVDPDLPLMHRDDWDQHAQANMKQWGHEIVHYFPSFDEAHQVMTTASEQLNEAPAILYITIPRQTPAWSIFDAGLFAQSLMLAATNQGLATIPTYNSVRYPCVLRRVLKIPTSQRIIIGVEIGYATKAKVNQYKSSREPLNQCLHFVADEGGED